MLLPAPRCHQSHCDTFGGLLAPLLQVLTSLLEWVHEADVVLQLCCSRLQAAGGIGTAVGDPFPPPHHPQCLISGKEFGVSKCVACQGISAGGYRNGAWLHDNEIVSACSYVCACPVGRG